MKKNKPQKEQIGASNSNLTSTSDSSLVGRADIHQQYINYFSEENPELLKETIAYQKLVHQQAKKSGDQFVSEVKKELPPVVKQAVESVVLGPAQNLERQLGKLNVAANDMVEALAKQGALTMVNDHNAQATSANESIIKYNAALSDYNHYEASSIVVKGLLGLDNTKVAVKSYPMKPLPQISLISEKDVPRKIVNDLADALGQPQFQQMTTLPITPETLASNIATTVGNSIDGLLGTLVPPEIKMTDNPLFGEDNSHFLERGAIAPPKNNLPHGQNVRVLEPPKDGAWSGGACLNMTIYNKPSSISGGNALLGLGLFFFCTDRLVGWMSGRYSTSI